MVVFNVFVCNGSIRVCHFHGPTLGRSTYKGNSQAGGSGLQWDILSEWSGSARVKGERVTDFDK